MTQSLAKPHTFKAFDLAGSQPNNQMMDDRSNTAVSTTTGSSTSRAPNWDHVPFEVGCARCGHDLRGRSEPKCPACDLEFDWADAVPIERLTCLHCGYHLYGLTETRCPECGEPFTWPEVLDDYRRRRKPLFEYRWREEPLRSFARTWAWASRPARLWSRLDIYDPPQTRALLAMVVVLFVLFAGALIVLGGLDSWLLDRFWSYRFIRRGKPAWVPGITVLPVHVLQSVSDAYLHRVMISAAAWSTLALAALLIFQQSMRRCQVKTCHVVRAWAYATPTMLTPLAAVTHLPTCLTAASGVYLGFPDADTLAAALLVVFTTWSLRRAYKTYLRMPHAGAVAVASQTIAVLAFGTGELIFCRSTGGGFFGSSLDALGLW